MPNYKKLRQIGAIGSLFWLIWICFFLFMGLATQPSSYILTEEFVKEVCNSKLLTTLGHHGMVFFVLSVLLLCMGATEMTDRPASYPIIIFLLVSSMFLFVLDRSYRLDVQKTIGIIAHEPRVETVTLNDKYAMRRKSSTSYYFVFSNGSTAVYKGSEYDEYSVGDEFYAIMCGDSCVRYYDPAQYELP